MANIQDTFSGLHFLNYYYKAHYTELTVGDTETNVDFNETLTSGRK